MTKPELLALLQQAAAALAVDQQPIQYTEEDRAMLRDIHAAVVAPAAAKPTPIADPPAAVEIPEVAAPPSLETASKKKSFWAKLGSGLKTTAVAIGAGGGAAALNAVVDSVQHGNISPTGLATSAIGAAITGAIAYRAQSPVPPKQKEG